MAHGPGLHVVWVGSSVSLAVGDFTWQNGMWEALPAILGVPSSEEVLVV